MKCPCHSGQAYSNCCEPFHKGELAPSPEKLMRSRYCAYSLSLVEYIIDTTHPDQGHLDPESIRTFCQNAKFEGLDILNITADTVTFTALLGPATFTEKSLFKQINSKWLYYSGELS